MRANISLLCASLFWLFTFQTACVAESPEATFFKAKIVRFVVGGGPGASGQLSALFFVGRDRSPLMLTTPSLFEVAELAPEAAWWIDFREDLRRLGRVMMVPPGIEPARLAFLRSVAEEILNDPAIVADFAAKGQPIQYASHQEVEALLHGILGEKITPARLQEIRQVVLEKFY